MTWILGGALALALLLCVVLFVKWTDARDSEDTIRSAFRNREMLIAQLRQNIADHYKATDALRAKIRRDLGNLHRLRLHWQGLRATNDPIAGHSVVCTCRWCLFDASLTLLTDRAEYSADERAAVGKQLEREASDLYNDADRGDRG